MPAAHNCIIAIIDSANVKMRDTVCRHAAGGGKRRTMSAEWHFLASPAMPCELYFVILPPINARPEADTATRRGKKNKAK